MQKLVFGPNVTVQTSHMAEVVDDFFYDLWFFLIINICMYMSVKNSKDRKIVGLIYLGM